MIDNDIQIKVCHIAMLFKPYFSGHGLYLEKVFRYFSERGVSNLVITSNYGGLKRKELIDGIPVYRVKMRKRWKRYLLLFSLQAILILYKKRRDYDVIHLHGLWDIYGLFTIYSKLFGKKVILHMVLLGGDDPLTIKKGYKFMNWRFRLLSFIDAFVPNSSPISNSYRQTRLPESKLFQIPQGVDTKRFRPAGKEEKVSLRKKLNLPISEKIVAFIGAIIRRKGVDDLIDAWSTVNQEIDNVMLILIGPDTFDGIFGDNVRQLYDFTNKMKKKANEKKLNVLFLGRSDKVDKYLRASNIFVLPSKYEGFPNTIVEAMATGLPVVITEMHGVARDFISSGKEGFIVSNSKELANKIIGLLENEELLEAMGKRARKKAVEEFDLEKICGRYIGLYRNLVYK